MHKIEYPLNKYASRVSYIHFIFKVKESKIYLKIDFRSSGKCRKVKSERGSCSHTKSKMKVPPEKKSTHFFFFLMVILIPRYNNLKNLGINEIKSEQSKKCQKKNGRPKFESESKRSQN